MANEFKHKDPCATLTQCEYIGADGTGHVFACQCTGDILYASSATVLKNLAKGAAGTVLSMGCSCIPAWTTNAASATVASTVVVVDGTDTSSFVAIFDSATGSLAPKTDAGLAYNAGTGTLTATAFAGPITGNVTGNASGTALTVTQAAQCAITSLGTLTALTVDDVAVNGKVVTMTGSACDTIVMTAAAHGAFSLVTTDTAAAAANIQITADGTVDIDSAGVLTLDSGAAINIEPAACSAILLDGTISVDAGVVTGATSITSTHYVTGNNGTVKFLDGDGNKYFTLAAHACTTACIAYTFPPAGGGCGNVLTTNGSGVLSWAAASGGPCQATKCELEGECDLDKYAPPDLIKHSPGVGKVWGYIFGCGALQTPDYNVSCVTDVGTGDRTINFTTAFSTDKYAVAASVRDSGGQALTIVGDEGADATGSVKHYIKNNGEGSHQAGANIDKKTSFVISGDQ